MKLAAAIAIVPQRSLTREEARLLFGSIFDASSIDPELAVLLRALATRGESAAEIAGAAEAMRAQMIPFVHSSARAIDTCGTGGDGLGTFNLSTAAALVAAASGARVIKHGNRAASSLCGSADLLEAAGVVIHLSPLQAQRVFEECGFVFLFAPAFHPALARIAAVRRELKMRTIFNLLGPLCNPGGVTRQLLGVGDRRRATDYATVLAMLGCEHGAVVHSDQGADELTLDAPNHVRWIGPGLDPTSITRMDAQDLGLEPAPLAALGGGDAQANLRLLQRVLAGERCALRDAVLLNAAFVIQLAETQSAVGAVDREALQAAVQRAKEAIESGAARALLAEVVACSRAAAELRT